MPERNKLLWLQPKEPFHEWNMYFVELKVISWLVVNHLFCFCW